MEEEAENARHQIPLVKEMIETNTQSKVKNIYPINNERHFDMMNHIGIQQKKIRNVILNLKKVVGKLSESLQIC
jgi:hypothetical protein